MDSQSVKRSVKRCSGSLSFATSSGDFLTVVDRLTRKDPTMNPDLMLLLVAAHQRELYDATRRRGRAYPSRLGDTLGARLNDALAVLWRGITAPGRRSGIKPAGPPAPC